MAKARMQWMDLVRGICIFLVVVVHAGGVVEDYGLSYHPALYWFNEFMNPFRIPLLMFLSGMLLHKGLEKPANTYLFGKFALIFWPFLLWSLITYAAEDRFTWEWILKTPISAPSVLWFLWFITAYYVLAYFVVRQFKLPIPLVFIVCMIGAELLPTIVRMPRFAYLFGFFLLGHYVVTQGWVLRLRGALGAVIGLGGLAAALYGGYLNTLGIGDKYGVLFLWVPLGMVAFILWASQAYSESAVTRPVEFVGRNSLVFYVAHFPVINIVARVTADGMITNGTVLYAAMVIAVILVSFALQFMRTRYAAVAALFDFRVLQQMVRRPRAEA